MAVLLGLDTGGTYTDAVLLDDETDQIVAKSKALTTRPDLSAGIGAAIDSVLQDSGIDPASVGLVSLSTTLATNALVEGHGGKVALVFIGFSEAELTKSDLLEALGDDPVIFVDGGHGHNGNELTALDGVLLEAKIDTLSPEISGIAVASRFATRNPAHEIAARGIIRARRTVPVTCSHELSQSLGGPKRALTAVLNARLIGLIDRLITAANAHMTKRDIVAPLMVVRGDGALVSAEMARERPIETILSGPAASVAGAQWLTGEKDGFVSDIGGTTTDICLLRDGLPKIDPLGAKVGKYRTMVEAVAMRTFGLGGDSEISVTDGLDGALVLGPKRVMPVSLFAQKHPVLVHDALDRALRLESPTQEATRFAIPQFFELPVGLDRREAAVAERLLDGPQRFADTVTSRVEEPALGRLVQRGLVLMADITPSDASHVLSRMTEWDNDAATKALSLMARRRIGSGERLAQGPVPLAERIVSQLVEQTSQALLETAFAEEGWPDPAGLARHRLTSMGRQSHSNFVRIDAGLALPVIGLGASARAYYAAVGQSLGCKTVLPEHGDIANAIGAVVGQVAIHAEGAVTAAGEGAFRVHLPSGPEQFSDKDCALDALRAALTKQATDSALASGVLDVRLTESLDLKEAKIEANSMFIEATLRISARGRPRIAR